MQRADTDQGKGRPARLWVRALATLAIIGVVGAIAAGGAYRPHQGTETPPADDKRSRPWHITFEELVHNDATGEGEAMGVVATSDQDTVVKADRFTWNDRKKTALATGHLHMSDEQTEGTAERVEIDYRRERRLMVLTGNVRLTLKPKKTGTATAPAGGGSPAATDQSTKPQEAQNSPTAEEDATAGLRDYPIEVTCDRVEYEYARDKRHAVLTGNFRAVQKLKDYTRTLTAERAEWFGREERVVLKGPVKLEDTKGRKGETPEDVEVFTKEGKEGIKLRKGTYTMPVEEGSEAPAASSSETGRPATSGAARP